MWSIVLEYVNERPILGYGYNSFWTAGRFVEIASYTTFHVADIHNSYLGVLLGLGYPGAICGVSPSAAPFSKQAGAISAQVARFIALRARCWRSTHSTPFCFRFFSLSN